MTNDLTTNAHRLLKLFERMRHQKPNGAMHQIQNLGLSFSHLRAMHVLAPDRTLPMKDLADELALTRPSITALTRRLVQTGLVRREGHENDSRVTLLSLTEEGQSLLQGMYHAQMQGMERLLGGLSSEEQELFLSLMERAVTALRDTDAMAAPPDAA